MVDVFISYSRKNKDKMLSLKKELLNRNIMTWTDEGIKPGTPNWKKAIAKAIIKSDCVVALWSPQSASSEWAFIELAWARIHDVPIYLFMIDGDIKASLPIELIVHQYIDGRRNFSEGIKELISTLQEMLLSAV